MGAASPSPTPHGSRVADIVAETLAHFGVRHAFGIPGGEVLTLIDALQAAGIRFVLNRHETPAASMAAGVSCVSGAPGLLVTTVGPGLANAVNAIADANQERVPLIVLTGVVDHDVRHRYTHQVLNQPSLLAPLVKGSFEVEGAGAGTTMARAIELAMTAPMGPVHVDLAPGTAARPAGDADVAGRPAESVFVGVAPDDEWLARIGATLGKASRPLVVAGFEAARSGAGNAVQELCERLGAPLITDIQGQGACGRAPRILPRRRGAFAAGRQTPDAATQGRRYGAARRIRSDRDAAGVAGSPSKAASTSSRSAATPTTTGCTERTCEFPARRARSVARSPRDCRSVHPDGPMADPLRCDGN